MTRVPDEDRISFDEGRGASESAWLTPERLEMTYRVVDRIKDRMRRDGPWVDMNAGQLHGAPPGSWEPTTFTRGGGRARAEATGADDTRVSSSSRAETSRADGP